MTHNEVIEKLAEGHHVERIVQNVAHAKALDADLRDLCQMVYLVLLSYDEDKIVDLYESDALGYFVARIAVNQFRNPVSSFHRTLHPRRCVTFETWRIPDTPDE